MAFKNRQDLQRWEIAVAKKLIGEFRRRSRSFDREEFDDLLQECLTHWFEVRRQLDPDPEDPPIAYMARVIRNKLIDLAREREAAKRRGDLDSVSLDETVSESDDAPTFTDLVDAIRSGEPGGEGLLDLGDLVQLPRGQAFALIHGGQLYKIRMPLPDGSHDPMMPGSLEAIGRELKSLAGVDTHRTPTAVTVEGKGIGF